MTLNNFGQCLRETGEMSRSLDAFHSAIKLIAKMTVDSGIDWAAVDGTSRWTVCNTYAVHVSTSQMFCFHMTFLSSRGTRVKSQFT